jgi:hypothetical protein
MPRRKGASCWVEEYDETWKMGRRFTMTKMLAGVLMLFAVTTTQAEEYGDLIRIEKLGERFEETGDIAFIYTMQVRCIGNYIVFSQLMESAGKAQSAANYLEAAIQMLEHTPTTKSVQADSKWTEEEASQIKQDAMTMAKRYADIFYRRLQHNYDTTGEQFGRDEVIKSDMSYCNRVAQLDFDAFRE